MTEYCPTCASVIAPGARFCSTCGTAIVPKEPGVQPTETDEGYARFYSDNPASAGNPQGHQQTHQQTPPQAPHAPVTPAAVTPPQPVHAAPPPAPAAPAMPPVNAGPTVGAGAGYAAAPVAAAPSFGYENSGSGGGNGDGGNGYAAIDDGGDDGARSLWPWLAGAGFLVAAFVGVYGYMQDGRDLTPISDTNSKSDGAETAAPATVINPQVTLYAAADANVRDKPTVAGTKVVSKVKRGAEVKGDVVAGAKGDQWLKLEGQEAYISLINLVKDAPAILASTSASDAVVKNICPVLTRAEAGAPVKVTLKAGAKVRITGLTQNGYAEFALPAGGAGYVEGEGKACLAGGEALTINFDPGACNFGPEIESYLDKAGTVASEGEMNYAPVNRSFMGLRVNSAFTGWETTGLTFDASIAEVRAAFIKAGYKLDADSGFIPSAESEGVASSALDPRNPSDNRGRTMLSCGV